MSQHFPERYERYSGSVKVELDLSNYATKADLKGATDVDTSSLAAKSDLASLKSKGDKIDVNKLKTVSADKSKLCNVVDNDFVKKTAHDKLATKVNTIDASGFVLKTQYNTDKSGLEKKIDDADKKIPNSSGLLKKTDYNAKITGIEGKIPSIAGLATTGALNAVENKILNVSDLIKKTDYNTNISDIETIYFTGSDCNKFTVETIDAKIKVNRLVDKSDISRFIGNSDLDKKKIATLATKAELESEQDKITRLQSFDSSCFRGKSYFKSDGTQNYLVFQPVYSYFKKFANSNHISAWKEKGVCDESFEPLTTSNNSLAPGLNTIF